VPRAGLAAAGAAPSARFLPRFPTRSARAHTHGMAVCRTCRDPCGRGRCGAASRGVPPHVELAEQVLEIVGSTTRDHLRLRAPPARKRTCSPVVSARRGTPRRQHWLQRDRHGVVGLPAIATPDTFFEREHRL
jgi:hypothetical protein